MPTLPYQDVPLAFDLKKHRNEKFLYGRNVPRDCPDLVNIIETMGDAANGAHAKLKVVEIPDDVRWVIEEYDGYEHIAEAHRTWD
jgi:hypothetical protein